MLYRGEEAGEMMSDRILHMHSYIAAHEESATWWLVQNVHIEVAVHCTGEALSVALVCAGLEQTWLERANSLATHLENWPRAGVIIARMRASDVWIRQPVILLVFSESRA